MAFSFQDIRYGWVALASLGVIAGTTIYVLNNSRQQVKPEDIIEIALGTHERCLVTQTSTNPVTYSVTPSSFVRTWTSNVYTTNGVTIYTNMVTNAIGWHNDRAMMIGLDATIKALVPYYVSTNTDYGGTTNITMLTVTGLWASLGIGNKTNQFTREPAWTNPISTNWIVNYTSYWPSTNGTVTNVIYTSDYYQVINYAASWTATGGHVWVTSSNWASEVVTVTNAATYGDYPWQVYVEDLQERYKVLNALQMTLSDGQSTNAIQQKHAGGGNYASLAAAWPSAYFGGDSPADGFPRSSIDTVNTGPWDIFKIRAYLGFIFSGSTTTNIAFTATILGHVERLYDGSTNEFLSFEAPGNENEYVWLDEFASPLIPGSNYVSTTYIGDSEAIIPDPGEVPEQWQRSWVVRGKVLFNWQFNYCTNKYW